MEAGEVYLQQCTELAEETGCSSPCAFFDQVSTSGDDLLAEALELNTIDGFKQYLDTCEPLCTDEDKKTVYGNLVPLLPKATKGLPLPGHYVEGWLLDRNTDACEFFSDAGHVWFSSSAMHFREATTTLYGPIQQNDRLVFIGETYAEGDGPFFRATEIKLLDELQFTFDPEANENDRKNTYHRCTVNIEAAIEEGTVEGYQQYLDTCAPFFTDEQRGQVMGELAYQLHFDAEEYEEAFDWAQKAAEKGVAKGQVIIGWSYDYGYGVSQDYALAAKWYRLAAEQGNALGQGGLGSLYANGAGVTQSYTEAEKWIRLGADQGDAFSQGWLGYLYLYGEGVRQSYTEAAKWYRLAADQGHAISQGWLGYLYYYGQGVTQSYPEAVKWYRLAADQGKADAQEALEAICEGHPSTRGC